jgi:hypothetical protein
VVSFTPRPLYLQAKSPWYPLDRRLGGLQNRSGRGGEEKNSQPLPGLEPPIIQLVHQCYTAELSRLLTNREAGLNKRKLAEDCENSFFIMPLCVCVYLYLPSKKLFKLQISIHPHPHPLRSVFASCFQRR